jgi:hypothetical protein
MIVDHLQRFFRNVDVAVACIYCNYKEQIAQTVSNLIASLVRQLVQDRSVISDGIKTLYELHHYRGTHPTLDELTEALESEIRTYSKVFVIVDALDECPEDGTRANLLGELQSLTGTVNLLVTSRGLSSIARQFEGASRLDIRATDGDVRRYIEGRIASVPRRHLKALREEIVAQVIEKAQGM